jgi:predicted secreted hydrolase
MSADSNSDKFCEDEYGWILQHFHAEHTFSKPALLLRCASAQQATIIEQENSMPKPIIFAIGDEFLKRDGLAGTVAPREDGQRLPTTRGTFEWWYFDAHFDDGTTAVIVYATKPIINPHVPLTPNLSLTVTRLDGTKTAQFFLPPAGQFSASKESCDVHIGACWVRQSMPGGRWAYDLHAETQNMSADLTFTGLVPPWRPGAGKSFFGDLDHYFAWLPSIPYGTVEGTLTYDGQEHRVKGTGYHDHNWGNVALPSVLDHWYWGRAHVGDYTLIFVEQIARKKYGSARLPVFLLAKGDQVLADDARYFSMQARDFLRHPAGREYPREVDFLFARSSERVRLALREQKLIEAVSLLGALPPFKRQLARLVANPYYFRFNTMLELEIELNGLRDSIRGPALYEIMMLR